MEKLDIIFQTDPNLNENINKYGCRFMSLLGISQYVLNKTLTSEQIIEIYNICSKNPIVMSENCLCGSKEHIIINKGFELLGRENYRGSQMVPWTVTNKEELKNHCKPESYLTIVEWPTLVNGEKAKHFMLADWEGNIIYDPGNETVNNCILKNYVGATKVNTNDIKPNRFLIYKYWRLY